MRPTRKRWQSRRDERKLKNDDGSRKYPSWKCPKCGNKDKDKEGNPPWVRHNGKRQCRKCGARRL